MAEDNVVVEQVDRDAAWPFRESSLKGWNMLDGKAYPQVAKPPSVSHFDLQTVTHPLTFSLTPPLPSSTLNLPQQEPIS